MKEQQHSKPCPKCGKPIGLLMQACKDCRKLMDKAFYQRNKVTKIVSTTTRKRELLEWYRSLKTGKPCFDCGTSFHFAAMDFDHREGVDKKDDVSHMVRTGCSKENIQIEIAKCILLCANCHRIRTFSRLKGKKYGW